MIPVVDAVFKNPAASSMEMSSFDIEDILKCVRVHTHLCVPAVYLGILMLYTE